MARQRHAPNQPTKLRAAAKVANGSCAQAVGLLHRLQAGRPVAHLQRGRLFTGWRPEVFAAATQQVLSQPALRSLAGDVGVSLCRCRRAIVICIADAFLFADFVVLQVPFVWLAEAEVFIDEVLGCGGLSKILDLDGELVSASRARRRSSLKANAKRACDRRLKARRLLRPPCCCRATARRTGSRPRRARAPRPRWISSRATRARHHYDPPRGTARLGPR